MGEDPLGFIGMSIMEDGRRIGDPSLYQTKVDMTHVDAPSSTMHRCTTKFRMDIGIWKAIVEGMRGSLFSVSKVISLESEGSTAPRVSSRAFHCVGHVLSTSRADMAFGVWAKSSTMLWLTAALVVALLEIMHMGGHENGGN